LVSSLPIFEKLFIGDLNGHVYFIRVGFDGVYEFRIWDKANSKPDESEVLVMLATWPPTTSNKNLTSKRSIMVQTTLSRQLDFKLLNSFSVSRVAKPGGSSTVIIFMSQTESSRAYKSLAH
jgi:hypothetical protein